MSAFIVWGWAVFLAITPIPAPVADSSLTETPGIVAFVTHYTCEYHGRNSMATTPGSCLHTADGSNPFLPGLACPDRSWLGRWVEIPGYGLLRCDDVPYLSEIYGLPHFDVRLVGEGAFLRAEQLGAGEMTIYPVQESPHALPVSSVFWRSYRACPRHGYRCSDDPTAHWRKAG